MRRHEKTRLEIYPRFLYWYEILSFALMEERDVRVFQSRVMKTVIVPKK